MNEIGSNCTVKKLNGCNGMDVGNNDGGGCCPSPYGTTNLSNGMRQQHTTPKNGCASPSMHHQQQQSHAEPMYATVKRTAARAVRNERQSQSSAVDSCHVYQYPLTLIGPPDSCFDSESCVSLTSTAATVSAPTTTAFIRMQDVDCNEDKNMTGSLSRIKF